MTDMIRKLALLLLVEITGCLAVYAQTPAALLYDPAVKGINFAAGDLKEALEQNGYTVTELPLGDPSSAIQSVRVIVTTQDVAVAGMPTITGMASQGYAIRKVADGGATNFWVIGQDGPGAMYGGLELAEAVKLADGLVDVADRQTNPHIAERGIKFNIPLDARSPSYSDDSSSAQPNIANMWEESFWTGFLDNMARHRYNMLSLWSLHPFPSMVRVPEYPNVALADVKQKSGALWDAPLVATGMYDPSWTLTTVKTMTMDEKIAFWRWVMQYAKDRGINLYIFTWNIFTYGTEPSGYSITDSATNPTTINYFRKSVKAMFNTYPLLAGVGVTAGENMHNLTSDQEEQWMYDAYGLGVSDAIADAENPASPNYAPGRLIRLIHRAHFADLNKIISYFQGLPGANNPDSTLAFSFKYSQAHMHSSTKPQFIYQNNWFNTIPAGKKVYLTVRNDDMYYMRWGDPDFARAYLTNFPDLSKIAGFYMGPDGYTWGREYLSTEPDTPRQLVIDKMWYSFLLYGRLAYEPTLPNARFEALLGEKFPEVPSSNLFQGWAATSKIPPLLTRFYWGALDFQWYPEACWSSSGFRTVQHFIDPQYDPMQSGEDGDRPLLMSVKQYVNGEAANGRLNPLEVANLLQQYADSGQAQVQTLSPGANKELRLTLGDINAMAWLGRYYAEKIRGAVDLYRYQSTNIASHHANARTHLIAASNHWSQYAALWSSQYVPQTLTRMGLTSVDIAGIQAKVNADIPAPLLPTTPENLPWVENFNLPTGTKSDGAPTSWTATRPSGPFEVNASGKLIINGNGGEGVLETADVNISGAAEVRISLSVEAAGGLDGPPNPDYIRIYKIVDGGQPTLLVPEILGLFTGTSTLVATHSGGSKLRLRVLTQVSADSEFYYFDDLKVELSQPSPTYTLDASASHGSVTFNPPGGIYNAGQVVTVTAVPDLGYTFDSWTGDLSESANPTTITMNGNKSIGANFTTVPTYTLTTNAVNGTITLNPPGGVYSWGTVVSIGATPSSGYTFESWSGDLTGSANPASITMDQNKSVNATFDAVAQEARNLLLVVGDAASMNAADAAIRARLQSKGHTVQAVSDDLSTTTDANGKALVLISSSVASGQVGTKFRDVAAPVINWEYGVQDDMGFTDGTQANQYFADTQSSINIIKADHSLAAGFPIGIRTVSTLAGPFSFGRPGGSPITIARLGDGTDRACLYAYEAQAPMLMGSAPARRVHLFLQNDTFGVLNEDGLKLFDAAVSWAMNLDIPLWYQSPVIENGTLRLEWLGGGTLQYSPDLLDPWTDIPGASSPYLFPMTDPAQFFRVKK